MYNIFGANWLKDCDIGLFNIYFGTDKENLDKSYKIVLKELKKLNNQKLGILQLSKAKKQLLGSIAISSENYENLMLAMGKSYLVFNYFDGVYEISKKLEKISADNILEIANEIFYIDKLSTLIYKW